MLSYEGFRKEAEGRLFSHRIITDNLYTKWFKKGEANPVQVLGFGMQFSVFSNRFLPIQCKNMIYAKTEEEERGGRSILGSELGVNLDIHTGDIESGVFHHLHAHINWLRETMKPICIDLGVDPRILGRQSLAYPTTTEFLDILEYNYAHPERNRRLAATVTVENWAAYGIGRGDEENNFWRETVVGFGGFNAIHRIPKGLQPIDPRFFQWHFDIEIGHANNVMEQLRAAYGSSDFNPELFLGSIQNVQDGIAVFWDGLYDRRSDSLDDLKKLLAK